MFFMRSAAEDLVRLEVDVIVTGVNPGGLAAKQATATIPIIMENSVDPVGAGLVASRYIQMAATTMISTRYLGDANRASTVARAGVLAPSAQASQAAFISLYVAMLAR